MRFIVVLFLLLLPTFLFASSFEEGFKAHQNREYQKAHQIWLEQANKGDVRSQHALAFYFYQNGNGGFQNSKIAIQWYEEAAKRGYAPSQIELGGMLKFDYSKKALGWFREAAKQGDADGMLLVGLMYKNGLGVKRDYHQAMSWFQQAIKKGGGHAGEVLGGNINALVDERSALNEVRSLNAIFEYMKKAEEGDTDARFRLVAFYVAVGDKKEAYHWISLMAENGNKNAQFHLAQYYNRGTIMAHDYQKALMWYRKSVAQGQKYAKRDLEKLEVFLELKKKAKQDKNSSDEYRVGRQYFLWHDYKRAFEMFQKSAKQGSKEGQYWLGVLYRGGRGTHKDYEQAKGWFQKAADQGKEDAKSAIRAINYIILMEQN